MLQIVVRKLRTARKLLWQRGAVGISDAIMRRYLWPLLVGVSPSFAVKRKRWEGMKWWRERIAGSPTANEWYVRLFTEHFNLSPEYYENKSVLDIGCGPRGTLEWADMVRERIGLDPLARRYREFGTNRHKMAYVTAPAEDMPFGNERFDVISCFNALDHVEDCHQVIREIARVTAPGGLFLLLTDVDHRPTRTEPQSFSWDVIDLTSRWFDVLEERHYEQEGNGVYDALARNIPYDHGIPGKRGGVLLAKLCRKPVAATEQKPR